MRKVLFLLCCALCSFVVKAQQPDYSSIKLDTKEDYTAQVDGAALQAANLVLSSPIDNNNLPRLQAAQFLIKWMTGTPAYTFSLNEKVTKLAKDDLLLVYMAALAKYCLENPSDKGNEQKVQLNAVKLLLGYCQQFDVKMNGELKRLRQANEKGELEKYLSK